MTAFIKMMTLGVCVAALVAVAQAEIHTVVLEDDPRSAFSMDSFAFHVGGHIGINVQNYSLYVDEEFADDVRWGIMLRKVTSKADGPSILAVEATRVAETCSLDVALQNTPELVLLLGDAKHTDEDDG